MKTGCQAILNCVNSARTTVQEVDFLAGCTCTGDVCPDVGSQLIAHTGFGKRVQRASIIGLAAALDGERGDRRCLHSRGPVAWTGHHRGGARGRIGLVIRNTGCPSRLAPVIVRVGSWKREHAVIFVVDAGAARAALHARLLGECRSLALLHELLEALKRLLHNLLTSHVRYSLGLITTAAKYRA